MTGDEVVDAVRTLVDSLDEDTYYWEDSGTGLWKFVEDVLTFNRRCSCNYKSISKVPNYLKRREKMFSIEEHGNGVTVEWWAKGEIRECKECGKKWHIRPYRVNSSTFIREDELMEEISSG